MGCRERGGDKKKDKGRRKKVKGGKRKRGKGGCEKMVENSKKRGGCNERE